MNVSLTRTETRNLRNGNFECKNSQLTRSNFLYALEIKKLLGEFVITKIANQI